MATIKYTALEAIVLESAASSVSFFGIPQSYRDLYLVLNYSGSNTTNAGKIFVNNDTTSTNYTGVRMLGTGSATQSNSNAGSIRWETQSTSGSITVLHFLDYAQTDKHKTVIVTAGSAATNTEMATTRWTSTAAINSITVNFLGTDLTIGSTLELYGVK